MDEDEKKPETLPLMQDQLHDMVYDPSLPLRPPKRPARPPNEKRAEKSAPPGYDPDTIDLFGDVETPLENLGSETIEDFRDSAEQMIEDLVEEYTEEISQRLRHELTEQLTSILDELNQPNSDKTSPDKTN